MSKDFTYIDVHGHLNFAAYDADRAAVINRCHEAGVAMITVGTDLESSQKCLELAAANDTIWAIVGLYPTFVSESHNDPLETGKPDATLKRAPQSFDHVAFKELALQPKVVAIGECGLDYVRSSVADIEKQKELFIQQINLANEVEKPLMLHVRNGKAKPGGATSGSAYLDAVAILKKHAKVRANFHCFTGSLEEVKEILDAGYTVSFTGIITFTHAYDEVVKYVPIDRVMSETDCPYLAPVPYRGKRNEPMYVVEVVKMIAKIREENEAVVKKLVVENAKQFFGI
jgi:TatD DNase family protein